MGPIPVDIVPSHVYLSQEDQVTLFGSGYAMTIDQDLAHQGQYAYEEMITLTGKNKRQIRLHVLGPNWERSFAELTPIEADYLSIKPVEAVSGDLSQAQPCTLTGPHGTVDLKHGAIVPKPHIRCTPLQARELGIENGKKVTIELLGPERRSLKDVLIRVHPTFQLRLELRADHARELWVVRPLHARIVTADV